MTCKSIGNFYVMRFFSGFQVDILSLSIKMKPQKKFNTSRLFASEQSYKFSWESNKYFPPL